MAGDRHGRGGGRGRRPADEPPLTAGDVSDASPEPAPAGGLRQALARAGAAAFELLRTRVELASVEFAEERERAKTRVVLVGGRGDVPGVRRARRVGAGGRLCSGTPTGLRAMAAVTLLHLGDRRLWRAAAARKHQRLSARRSRRRWPSSSATASGWRASPRRLRGKAETMTSPASPTSPSARRCWSRARSSTARALSLAVHEVRWRSSADRDAARRPRRGAPPPCSSASPCLCSA